MSLPEELGKVRIPIIAPVLTSLRASARPRSYLVGIRAGPFRLATKGTE